MGTKFNLDRIFACVFYALFNLLNNFMPHKYHKRQCVMKAEPIGFTSGAVELERSGHISATQTLVSTWSRATLTFNGAS